MKQLIYLIAVSVISMKSFGHGESKPGPNGGFIRMPGAFHTEVIPDKKDSSFHLFLLNLEFKNPTVENSSVEAVVEQKRNKKVKFSCEVMGGSHYHCKPDGKYSMSSGKLTLKVKREGAEGVAEYQLPLKWANDKDSSNSEMDHSKHH
jgi:hypothetical protein